MSASGPAGAPDLGAGGTSASWLSAVESLYEDPYHPGDLVNVFHGEKIEVCASESL